MNNWKHLILLPLFFAAINFYAQTAKQDDEFFVPTSKGGGYGELHYNVESADGKDTKKTLDFHRFVLFYSHNWSPKWSFQAEVELEHNYVDGGSGELELEQAYVNYRHNQYIGFRAGVVLNSVGIINQIHEPPTFLTVERPEYAKYIIPTTWFGNGAAIFGSANAFHYRVTIMEGLDNDKLTTANIAKQGIRSGRQKGFKADARNLLYNAALRYTGIKGVRLGTSYTYNEAIGDSTSNKIGLIEFHGQYRGYNVVVNAEYGNISYSEGEIETSSGYYIEVGYNVGQLISADISLTPYFHYTDYNTATKTLAGGDSEKATHRTKWMLGISYLPIDQVVFKLDYGERTIELGDKKTNLFNIGVGYMF